MAIGKTIGKLSIRVIPDASKFRNDLKLLIQRVEKTMVANLTVRADTREAMLEITRLRVEAERNGIRMGVALNDTVAAARLAALARTRSVRIAADVDQNSFTKVINGSKGIVRALSGWSLVQETIHDFKKQLLALPEAVPSIAKIALAIGNLGAVALSGIGGTSTVLADLGSLIGILPALPGVLIGAGIGLSALVMAAKDGGKYLGGLKKPLADLQNMVSTTFWAQAAGPINTLVTSLLPQLQAGFKNVSNALGVQAAAVAQAIQAALGGGVLEGWFSTVAQAMGIITPHVQSFVNAFVTLGTTGLSFMPAFAKWVGQIGDDFNAWVQAAASGGQFTTWVGQAVNSLKALFSIGGSLIGIVGALNTAAVAAGGNGLMSMAGVLKAIQTTLESPAVQKGLTALFAGAGQGVSSLTAGITNLLGSLGGLAPTLGSVLGTAGQILGQFVTDIGTALNQPAIQKGLTDLFSGLQVGLASVGQVLPQVGLVIGNLMTALGTAMSTFGPLLAAIKETFAPKLVIMAQAANDLIPILGTALTGAVKALQGPLDFVFSIISANLPLFEGLVLALGGGALAFTAITKTVGLFQGAMALAKGVQAGFAAASYGAVGATYAQTAAQKAGLVVGKLVALAQAAVTGALWNQIAALASTAGAWLANKAKIVAASAAQLATVAGNLAKEAAAWVAMKVQALASSAAVAAGVVKDLAKQGAAWAAQKLTLVAAAAQWALLKGAQLAGAVATGVATAAQWLFNAAMSANPIALVVIAIAALVAGLIWFFTQTKLGQEIWANFVSFLTQAWANIVTVATTVFGAIGTFISDVWNGIVTTAQNVWNAITSFLGTWGPVIIAVLAPFLGIPLLVATHWQEIVKVATDVWNAVTKFVSDAIDTVSKYIGLVLKGIGIVWDDFWSGVFGFLKDTWDGITGWVSDAIANVKKFIDLGLKAAGILWNNYWSSIFGFLKDVWNGITGWVSDAIANVKKFIDLGMQAAKVLWNNYWSTIFSFLRGIWDGITGWVSDAISNVKGAIDTGINAAKRIWDSVWSGIKSTVSNAWDGIRTLVDRIVSGISGLVGDIGRTLSGIPGKVKDAFSGAGTWLLHSGQALIQGFIDGIAGMVQKAAGAAKGVVDAVARFFPNSPAKEGPFSGSGWTPHRGAALGLGFVEGMDSTVGKVKKGALRLMQAASQGTASIGVDSNITPSAAALSGLGGGITIQGNVGWQPDELLREAELAQRQKAMAYGIDSLAALA